MDMDNARAQATRLMQDVKIEIDSFSGTDAPRFASARTKRCEVHICECGTTTSLFRSWLNDGGVVRTPCTKRALAWAIGDRDTELNLVAKSSQTKLQISCVAELSAYSPSEDSRLLDLKW